MEFGPLRQHILQLAVSGQLVEQLDSEPAVEQVGPAPKPDEVPFELPPKWKWVQLGALLPFKTTTKVAPEQIPPHSWLLGLEEIEKGGRLLYKRYDWDEVSSIKNAFKAGDVLYGKMNPHLNKVIMADEDGFCSTEMLVFDTKKANVPLVAGYLLYFLRSPFFVGFASSHSHGLMPRLGPKMCQQALMPLPPFEEQRRIVAKIEALLGRLDQMETAYSEFAGPMTMHFRNLMLDKAIRGELVPQLDSEPEVKQVGPAPKPDEVPFELPSKWKWVQLSAVSQYNPSVQADDELEVSFVPLEDLSFGFETELCFNQNKPWSQVKKGYKRFKDGDVIFAKIHPSFQNRKSGLVTNAYNGMGCGSTEFCVYRCAPQLLNKYLLWFFKTDYFINFGKRTFKGTVGQQRVNLDVINSMYIPLPPLEEQRRIVAKVEELLAGVKQLSCLMEYA